MRLITVIVAALIAVNSYAADSFAGNAYTYDGTSYTHVPLGAESWSDYLIDSDNTKFCFYVPPNATSFGVQVVPTQVGTDDADSLNLRYRPLSQISDQTITTGSALIPLPLRTDSGDVQDWIDWTSGSQYFVYDSTGVEDFSPISGRWIEIWARRGADDSGGDSSYVTIKFLTFPLQNTTVK